MLPIMIDEAVRCDAQNPGPFWYNRPIATGTANSFSALRLLQLQVLDSASTDGDALCVSRETDRQPPNYVCHV